MAKSPLQSTRFRV